MDVELKPCPMCGGEAHLERQGHVACKTGWPCVHTAYFNWGTPDERNAAAITAWNTRHDHSPDAGKMGDSRAWPTTREVARIGDMDRDSAMRVGFDNDNDVYVSVVGEDPFPSVEFCTPGSGGGKSPRTREALIALMVAMEADNAETPTRDWWARRRQKTNDAARAGERGVP